jgi:TonB family protein
MSKLAVILSSVSFLSICACASGSSLGVGHQSAQHTGLRLDLSSSSDSSVQFPAAIEPAVPSVDRISRAVFATLGDTASAQLDLCVSPSGRVTKLELAQSSSMPELDEALLRDARTWRFASMPGPDSVQICKRASVTYRPY